MKILVTGISGRMGQAVKQAVELNEGTELGSTHDVGQDIAAAMSAKYDGNQSLAATGIFISTLFAVPAIPLMMYFLFPG